jgi:hypothetical protein
MTAESTAEPLKNSALNVDDRLERKRLKREAKAEKKALRQRQKLENRMRLDKRPEVRMEAKLKAQEVIDNATGDNKTAHIVQDDHLNATSTKKPQADKVVSLMDLSLTQFSLTMISYTPSSILELDLSHNCLSEIPGLSQMKNLTSLDICRNEFRSLPESLRELPHLTQINASRNQLRASADLLVLLTKPPLPSLQSLDLTFNKKLFTQSLLDILRSSLPSVAISMTVTSPPPTGAYIGNSPGERDPLLLRSQLEPFTTLELRKRLVETFGHEPYSNYGAPPPGRAEVMSSLLAEYAKLGPDRKLVRSLGKPVPDNILKKVQRELESWSDRYDKFQERPMIKASKYMILRSPTEAEEKMIQLGSRRAHSAIRKYQQNLTLWEAAKEAMASVDKEFADQFTGLAVTKNFVGSPHIDTTNIGPFYGLSIGDFEDGTGGVRVELDPLTVCEVNTKNRLGRVDGRFPHFVGPYDETKTRYSLIFYLTEGEVQPKTKAVFGEIIE